MHIRFLVGGPAFHPVAQQATLISTWLPSAYRLSVRHDADALRDLDDVDLLVLMGMHWPGMSADWAGNLQYTHPDDAAKASFLRYCDRQGKMLIHHGAIGGYDDWEEFGQRVGVKWGWQRASHSPFQNHTITIGPSDHPVVAGMHPFTVDDEIYYKLWMDEQRQPTHHAWAEWDNDKHPMITTLAASAQCGPAVYLALGHNMRSLEPPMMRRMWQNSVSYLLGL
jgi:hypothetical protein